MHHYLLDASIMHQRHGVKKNRFVYKSRYMMLDVEHLDALNHYQGVGYNKKAWVSVLAKDHLPLKDNSNMMSWVKSVAKTHGLLPYLDRVVLMAMPRVCGYVFNPVSFWFILDPQGALRGVIAVVNNTFHERYCYVCYHNDYRVIQAEDVLYADKVFYVSPFIEIKGHYQFRFQWGEDVKVWIEQYQNEGKLLTATVAGKQQPIEDQSVFKFFMNKPWRTLMVMWLIHYQALKLWLKKVGLIEKPKYPPKQEY